MPWYNRPMPGDLESNMKFIVEQQAQFAADVQLLKERQDAAQKQIDENRKRIAQLVDVTKSLARHAEETDSRVGHRIEELAEAQARTDERLNALIDTVDKLVRHNGSPKRGKKSS